MTCTRVARQGLAWDWRQGTVEKRSTR